MLTVSTFIAMLLTRQPVEEEVYRKALAQARLTAHNLMNDKALENPQNLGRVLGQMQHDVPGVRQADVFVHSGKTRLLASTNPSGKHEELDAIPQINDPHWAADNLNEFERPNPDQMTVETHDGKYWVLSTGLRENGKLAGCLVLRVSKLRSDVITQNIVEGNFLLMLCSLVVLIFVVHGFFLKSVRAPVKEMIRVMKSAEGGQLHVRSHTGSEDEIGQLSMHLNGMLDRIENFSNELARKIKDATQELAGRNAELTRINEELFETQKSLARSERLAVAGQLAASLAHEIGTPLNSISGHVQLMARRKTGDPATDRRLEIIQKQIDNIVRTVKQLLSWTRKYDLRLEEVDLRRVLDESVLLSSPSLEVRKIKVRTHFPADCPSVYGDPGYLQQVFLNLINNSMDSMPHGGFLDLGLAFVRECKSLAVEVKDTGEGITADNLDHIFDPMFTTKRLGTGAGLGLAICSQIIRQHGGTIEAESEINCGTRFTIIIPLDCREKTEAAPVAGHAGTLA
ncbi:MAG: HAMP domain-containing protein [Acidobacteriota bacterium]|nr:HAMP domain-containing protein [Acidobacteriota bacterium]